MKKIIVAALGCILLAACDSAEVSTVVFKEPQPAGKKALSEFPKSIRGLYDDREQRSLLIIDAQRIVRIEDYYFTSSVKELDNSLVLTGDSLLDKVANIKYKATIEGDSLWVLIRDKDTLFDINNPEHVVKKFKGYYFLNRRNDTEGWTVVRLSLEQGKLIRAMISDSVAISNLKELAEKPSDTINRQYVIGWKQFRTFNRNHGFTDLDTFFRVGK